MKVYGPYTRKDGRQHIILYDPITQKRKTISYPKYLIEQYLGRELEADETVDHIDRDFTNNDLSNLQILKRHVHSSLDAYRSVPYKLTCQWCTVEFERLPRFEDHSKKQGKKGVFCSRKCAGKYGKYIQQGGKAFEEKEVQTREYYSLKDIHMPL